MRGIRSLAFLCLLSFSVSGFAQERPESRKQREQSDAAAQQQETEQQEILNSDAGTIGARVRRSPEQNVMAARAEWAAERRMNDQCKTFGCLAIVNMTDNYDAIGLYLDTGPADRRATPSWSPNQLQHARLAPHKAFLVLKSGNATMCGLPARVELEQQKTRAKVTMLGEVDLCRNGQNSRLLIRVVRPEVAPQPEEPGKAP